MKRPILLDIPESFDTERLTIRAPHFGDGAPMNAAIQESIAELQQWMPWAQTPPTVEDSEEFSRHTRAQYLERRDFGMRLWLKDTETFVGASGLHAHDWMVPAFEIGYWCRTRFVGRGYISEAVRAITRFGFEMLGAERIVIRCDALNTRSAAVARRCGYTLEGITRSDSRAPDSGSLRDTMVFAMLRGEFRP
ncbi:MAG: GNAT family N-acetyltransferase [Chloroflexi bacterium]|nr:GNAT family N-acetyltransferase [Chloroflexota bacterium]